MGGRRNRHKQVEEGKEGERGESNNRANWKARGRRKGLEVLKIRAKEGDILNEKSLLKYVHYST